MIARTATLFSLGLALALAPAMLPATETGPTIAVSGEGRAGAAPDMARLRVGVETEGRDAAAALAENSSATARVIARLKESGVPAADIRTSSFAVRPIYGQSRTGLYEQRIEGFAVVNAVSARIGDLAGLGAVLDALVRDGANRIDSLEFGIADPAPVLAEARADAIAQARAAAETYAAAAGMTLGPVLSISDLGGPPQPLVSGAMLRMEASSVPIEPGTAEIAASVSVVWALAPGR